VVEPPAGSATGDDQARLFVALELPDAVRHSLARWATALAVGNHTLRAVRAEALHVTLCFLGARPLSEIDAIGAACASVVGPPGFELATGSVLSLPPRRPRVVAVAIEDRRRGLTRLQSELSRELSALGVYTPERPGFLPHVTIARTVRAERFDPARLRGRTAPRLLAPMHFEASTVTLYRSRSAPGGSVYEPLSVFLDQPR
jgi:2'-5' RNA ligase